MVKKKRQPDTVEENSSSDGAEETNQSPAMAACTCQHVKKGIDVNCLRKSLKANGLALGCWQCMKNDKTNNTERSKDNENPLGDEDPEFEYDKTLWLCLKCGTQLCGRARNQHALNHFKTPHSDCHALTMNIRSYEIWCYECNNEVRPNSRKNLLECVEMVKKISELSTWAAMCPIIAPKEENIIKNKPIELPALPLPPIPIVEKRANDVRVRGLTNLGNTCFFNAVMQCLAQTPYLLKVLKESCESREEFILPGGTYKFKSGEVVELPMIKRTLNRSGDLTEALVDTLDDLQSGGGVLNPSRLFDKLCMKCPQFRGGDQHDSHELLRHLLESVRSEDLRRYQKEILYELGCNDQANVSEEMREKLKFYGGQAADRILCPEQVFRGFLVSTLTCQECFNVSSRHENFLDVSLPVSVEKPQLILRKMSPEPVTESFYLKPAPSSSSLTSTSTTTSTSIQPLAVGSSLAAAVPTVNSPPSKSQLKKEKENERKAKRAAKHQKKKLAQKLALDSVMATNDGPTVVTGVKTSTTAPLTAKPTTATATTTALTTTTTTTNGHLFATSTSSSEESDADVEDNLADDNDKEVPTKRPLASTAVTFADPNGNNEEVSSVNLEKRDDSPENMDKDSLDEDENDSGIATSPANPGSNFLPSSETNGGSNNEDSTEPPTLNSIIMAVGLTEKGANLVRQLSQAHKKDNDNEDNEITNTTLTKNSDQLSGQIGNLQLSERKAARMLAKRVRTQSHSDWSTTMAPRYQCDDGECSIQSCLNNFTAVELMSGNNKVGCENCTKNINGDNPKAKTIYTNATKQFLISSPPAVLILHLKRFQLGPRCIFRKLTRHVDYPMILDIAPFCGSKVKILPNINRRQKKLLYSLYGVVEHSGGMYGGHYTAYVKVRSKLAPNDKRWEFLPQGSKAELDQDDEQRKKLNELLAKEKAREMRLKAVDDSDDFSSSSASSSSSSEMNDETTPTTTTTTTRTSDNNDLYTMDNELTENDIDIPQGKWYYVSDSHVQEVSTESVLRAQAYLLFYERIY